MNENRYAILIANSQFPEEPKFTPLRCPERDADELSNILRSEQSNFTEVVVLKNEPYHKILKTISRTLRKGGKDDLYLIYYSGHGKLDLQGNLYLATFDTTIDDLLVTAIEATKILDLPQEHFKRKTVLILDCCYSGAIERRFKNDISGMLEVTFKSDADEIGRINSRLKNVNSKGTYVLTASTSNQQAVEKEGDDLSLFTKHIIEGIRTGDASVDGEITMSNLYEYVRKKVAEEGYQEPMKFETEIQGSELVIASVDVEKFSTQKLSKLGRELIFVKYEGNIPAEIQGEALDILSLNREFFSPEQKKKFALIQDLIKNPKTVEAFVNNWNELRNQQQSIIALYGEAQAAIDTEEWEQAVQKLNIVLEMDPDHKQALNDLALAQQQLKLAELYKQGDGFYRNNEFGKAIPYFEQIQMFFPNYKEVGVLLKRSQREKQLRDQQAQEEKEHAELDRKQKEALAALASVYDKGAEFFEQGNWHEALKCFQQIRDKDADFPALNKLIEDSKMLINADDAIKTQDLRKLVEARDSIRDANKKDPQQWQKYFLKISEGIDRYLYARFQEAKKLFDTAQFSQALEIYTHIRDIDHQFMNVNDHIARTVSKLTQITENPNESNPASGILQGKNANNLFHEARVAIGTGAFALAIEKLEQALILKPGHKQLLEELEKARKQQKLATLYAAAQERITAQDWNGALEYLYGIHDEQEFYKDADELIISAEKKTIASVANGFNNFLDVSLENHSRLIAIAVTSCLIAGLLVVSVVIGYNSNTGTYNAQTSMGAPVTYPSSIATTPTKDKFSGPEIDKMVSDTIYSFNSAIKTEDFTDFHSNSSQAFREQISVKMLKNQFADFIKQKDQIRPILTASGKMTPVYSPEPKIKNEGRYKLLEIRGQFDTKKKTIFAFDYVQENGYWRLLKIDIKIE